MSNSLNTIINQLTNLDKEFQSAKNKNEMVKILYYIRVLHGDILMTINKYQHSDDIKK